MAGAFTSVTIDRPSGRNRSSKNLIVTRRSNQCTTEPGALVAASVAARRNVAAVERSRQMLTEVLAPDSSSLPPPSTWRTASLHTASPASRTTNGNTGSAGASDDAIPNQQPQPPRNQPTTHFCVGGVWHAPENTRPRGPACTVNLEVQIVRIHQ